MTECDVIRKIHLRKYVTSLFRTKGSKQLKQTQYHKEKRHLRPQGPWPFSIPFSQVLKETCLKMLNAFFFPPLGTGSLLRSEFILIRSPTHSYSAPNFELYLYGGQGWPSYSDATCLASINNKIKMFPAFFSY